MVTLIATLAIFLASIFVPAQPASVFGTEVVSESVNRTLKGDRMAVVYAVAKKRPTKAGRDSKPPKRVVGCEPLFSPVASPAMAHLTGRCMA